MVTLSCKFSLTVVLVFFPSPCLGLWQTGTCLLGRRDNWIVSLSCLLLSLSSSCSYWTFCVEATGGRIGLRIGKSFLDQNYYKIRQMQIFLSWVLLQCLKGCSYVIPLIFAPLAISDSYQIPRIHVLLFCGGSVMLFPTHDLHSLPHAMLVSSHLSQTSNDLYPWIVEDTCQVVWMVLLKSVS